MENKQKPPPPYEATVGVDPSCPLLGQPNRSASIVMATAIPLGPASTHTVCPHCFARVGTVVHAKPGTFAYLSGLALFLCGCWLGCCLIPCFVPAFMDVHHTCPNCQAFLGIYTSH